MEPLCVGMPGTLPDGASIETDRSVGNHTWREDYEDAWMDRGFGFAACRMGAGGEHDGSLERQKPGAVSAGSDRLRRVVQSECCRGPRIQSRAFGFERGVAGSHVGERGEPSGRSGERSRGIAESGRRRGRTARGRFGRGGNNVANRVNDPYWSLNPKNDPGTDFLDASSRVHLPAFAEIEWVATPLPTARKTSIMEFVVFPALGMLVLILLVTLLVLRIRRQRPLDRDRQLLHV